MSLPPIFALVGNIPLTAPTLMLKLGSEPLPSPLYVLIDQQVAK